jgi:hypothetical protein
VCVVFVRFAAGEIKNTTQTLFEKIHVKNFLQKKLGGGGGFLIPVVFPLRFFTAFLAVSLHEELKNTTQIFQK